MRTKSRCRGRGLVLAVLTLIVSMPELAQAQQSGLFPLAPIKRQRVPCDQQDPAYKLYKEKYFGYHPPCWRPFPTGWGCPSPEKPDVEKSFREQKLGTVEGEQQGDRGETPQGDQGPTRPAVPALPNDGRSPFEQPAQGGDRPGNAPAPRREPASPFELDDSPAPKPNAAPGAPRGAGRARPATPAIGDGGPELSSPDESGRVQGARTSRISRDEQVQPRSEGGPLLALPEVTLGPVAGTDASFGTQPAQAVATADDSAGAQQAPTANSSPRRGFLSGLFNNLGLNWTRR